VSCDLYAVFLKNLEAMSVTPQNRIMAAVSGGPDSMALLHLLWRFNPKKVGVFHLNHGFRETAAQEAAFVREYAEKLGVPVQLETYDITGYLAQSGESKQAGARKIRYRLMNNYAEANGYHRIALGHHGDDQAETVLMRILRGAGLHGLGGIPPRRETYIRPLLNIYKQEILQYCHEQDVPYVIDESNLEPVYLRNKIRQQLLPLLEREYNSEIKAQLVQLADLAREDELELQNQAQRICEKHLTWQRGQVLFPRQVFSELSIAMQRRVLRALLRVYRGHLLQMSFIHIEEWRLQLMESSSFQLSLPQVSVFANKKHIFVGDLLLQEWSPVVLEVPGQVQVGHFTIRAELLSTAETKSGVDAVSEDFDLDALKLPLVVRPRREGDRMQPFGSTGRKKVKDLLIDAHIPLQERDFLPLVCDQEDVLWIPTVRRSAKGALGSSTERVLRLSCPQCQ
jgi:tRNA(Ile)-lysidine synthase